MSQVEWKKVRLGDVCSFQEGYVNPSQSFPKYFDGDVKWLRATDLNNGPVYTTSRTLTKEGFESAGKSALLFKPNTIGISKSGTIGRLGILKDYMCGNRAVINIAPNATVDVKFIFYSLLKVQDHFENIAVGSVQKNLYVPILSEMEISLPPLEDQKRIAGVLSSLDDKIELNNKINKNLEEQIDSIIYEMVLLNESCQRVKLGDYLYIKGRIGWKGLKKDEYLDSSGYRIINGESLMDSGVDWTKAGYISKERYDESPEIMLEVGDILLSKDGTIGKIGYIDSLELPTSVASGIFVIRNQQQENISTAFIYYLLKSRLFKGFIEQRTEGSVIPHLYQKDFMDFIIPLPISQEMKKINDVIQPMFEKVIANLNENKNLIRQRNALLPKLMSIENFSNA